MDASKLKVASTSTIHVKNAAGEPQYEGDQPVQIIVHGPGSRAFATIDSRQTARQFKRMNDNDGKITAPTAEERRAEAAEDLAELTIEFKHLTYGDAQGAELFRALYADPELGFIVLQVSKHLKDWANFQIGSSAS